MAPPWPHFSRHVAEGKEEDGYTGLDTYLSHASTKRARNNLVSVRFTACRIVGASKPYPRRVRESLGSACCRSYLCTVLTENSVGSTLQNRDEVLLGNYPAVVVDLGVTWLDSGMSPLIRPTDPILLVARYGQTKRQELASAAAGLRAANRALAGVIFNAAANPVASTTKKF